MLRSSNLGFRVFSEAQRAELHLATELPPGPLAHPFFRNLK